MLKTRLKVHYSRLLTTWCKLIYSNCMPGNEIIFFISNNPYNPYNLVAREALSETFFGDIVSSTTYQHKLKIVFSQGKMYFHKGDFNYELN
jgi:hypothetical protein